MNVEGNEQKIKPQVLQKSVIAKVSFDSYRILHMQRKQMYLDDRKHETPLIYKKTILAARSIENVRW